MFNVLIIDDEPWAREVVKSLGAWDSLELSVVGEAEDGKTGLRLITELHPDIVITDMRMPGIDGIELLKRINTDFPSIKIIVMSGYDDFVYLKQAIASRALDYLLKPFDEAELNDALTKCREELKERRKTNSPLSVSPVDFSSDALNDRYLILRQRALASFIELDIPGIMRAFEQLNDFLSEEFKDGLDDETMVLIQEDYAELLMRFLNNHYHFSLTEVFGEDEAMVLKDHSLHHLSLLCVRAIEWIQSRKKSKTRLTIDGVIAYIEKHYADPISLESIAQHFYVSKEHLSRAFKSTTGENLSDFIVRTRMEKAKNLLEKAEISIKHAARLTGYPELPYFHRVFKKQFGITPGEFKRQREK